MAFTSQVGLICVNKESLKDKMTQCDSNPFRILPVSVRDPRLMSAHRPGPALKEATKLGGWVRVDL